MEAAVSSAERLAGQAPMEIKVYRTTTSSPSRRRYHDARAMAIVDTWGWRRTDVIIISLNEIDGLGGQHQAFLNSIVYLDGDAQYNL